MGDRVLNKGQGGTALKGRYDHRFEGVDIAPANARLETLASADPTKS
ncbi:MAG: hypothetical protein LBG81_08300 [Coriobacteriaceae bacterium]|jgi:hypothetical protein|nr:hypothetical protein [Coriobacteriaceae bacterium]